MPGDYRLSWRRVKGKSKKSFALLLALTLLLSVFPSKYLLAEQNETTFENPVIWADVPDPSVIRVGDTYYMSSTTMHMNPGLPIMKSHDLINWEIVNYAYDYLERGDVQSLRNGQDEYGNGSWASSLRYHEGTFYIAVFSHSAGKTYIFQTDDIENGDWTRSTIEGAYHDMSLLFDDDGRVYMVYGINDIRVIELTSDATEIKEGGLDQVIIPNASHIAGSDFIVQAEGAHLQKIDGHYYVFLITWPQGEGRTQLVYRADSIDGDYEGRIALDDSGIAQGGIVDTVNGYWYGFLFGDRGSVGRIPYLVPVTWEDGWPVFGEDGKVPEEMRIPVGSAVHENAIVASDEFYQLSSMFTKNNLVAPERDSAGTEELETFSGTSEPVSEGTELLENVGFEDGHEPWSGNGDASVEVTDEEADSGSNSLLTTGRKATGDGPRQFITGKVTPGERYAFSAKVKYTEGPDQKSFNFAIQNGPTWEGIEVMGSGVVEIGEWGTIEGTYTLPTNANTSETFIFIETPWSGEPDPVEDLMDFYVDDISIVKLAGKPEEEKSGEFDDNGSELSLVWQWNHNPDNNYWSLTERPGYLRLINGRTSTSIHDTRNTLTQRTFGPESSGSVALEIGNMRDGDFAGLAAFQENYGYVGVKSEGGSKSIIMVDGNSESSQEIESVQVDQERVYFKIDFDYKDQLDNAYFYYSLNGVDWTSIGDPLEMSYTLPHFMGYRFALFNYATKNAGGFVDFDYFRIDDKVTGTETTDTVLNADIGDVSDIIGAPYIEFEIPVSMDELPEGEYTSISSSFNIPGSLTVTDVEFNDGNISGDSSYTFSNNQLKLHVEGDQVNFTNESTDLFATIHLKVNQFITSDRTDMIKTDYINVSGGDIVYNVHNATANVGLNKLETEAIAKIPGYSNPLITHKLGADPNVLVQDDRVYMYMTNDEIQYDEDGNIVPNDYGYINTITVISSADLVNWTDHGAIPVAGPDGAATWASQSWAVTVTQKEIDGEDKFFLYFSNNASGVGVLTADNPLGPWTDPRGSALVDHGTPGNEGVPWVFDPAVFVDDDGQGYLYYGGGIPGGDIPTEEQQSNPKTARVVKLSDDMIELAGEPQMIDAPFMFEAAEMHKHEDQYYFSYSTNFSQPSRSEDMPGSGEIAYMIGDDPMGPFTYVDSVIKNPHQYFEVGGNNHHEFFEFKGKWYAAYHAQTVAKELGAADGYRSPHLNEIGFYENGYMKEVKPNMEGVSQVTTLNPYERTEAETIAWNAGISTEESEAPGSIVDHINLHVTDINDGDWIAVSNADFGENGAEYFQANIASTVGGSIEIRLDSPIGETIGTLEIEPTSGEQEWSVIETEVSRATGIRNIFFMFSGEGEGNLFNFDYWQFKEAESGNDKSGDAISDDKDDQKLPETATNLYNYLIFGTILFLVGTVLAVKFRRKEQDM